MFRSAKIRILSSHRLPMLGISVLQQGPKFLDLEIRVGAMTHGVLKKESRPAVFVGGIVLVCDAGNQMIAEKCRRQREAKINLSRTLRYFFPPPPITLMMNSLAGQKRVSYGESWTTTSKDGCGLYVSSKRIVKARTIPIDGVRSDLRKSYGEMGRTKQDFNNRSLENQRILLNYVPVSSRRGFGNHARQRVCNPRSLSTQDALPKVAYIVCT